MAENDELAVSSIVIYDDVHHIYSEPCCSGIDRTISVYFLTFYIHSISAFYIHLLTSLLLRPTFVHY